MTPPSAGLPRLDGSDPHLAVTAHLEQLIRRGQRAGDFDSTLPASWVAAAILALGHTAAEQVAAGRLTSSKAAAILLDSTLRLCGATGAPAATQRAALE